MFRMRDIGAFVAQGFCVIVEKLQVGSVSLIDYEEHAVVVSDICKNTYVAQHAAVIRACYKDG